MATEHLPVVWRAPTGTPDSEHHTREWTSGTRGGGKVPADYQWNSNPKVEQEENGASQTVPPVIPAPIVPQK